VIDACVVGIKNASQKASKMVLKLRMRNRLHM